jgi:hypothetical protein
MNIKLGGAWGFLAVQSESWLVSEPEFAEAYVPYGVERIETQRRMRSEPLGVVRRSNHERQSSGGRERNRTVEQERDDDMKAKKMRPRGHADTPSYAAERHRLEDNHTNIEL